MTEGKTFLAQYNLDENMSLVFEKAYRIPEPKPVAGIPGYYSITETFVGWNDEVFFVSKTDINFNKKNDRKSNQDDGSDSSLFIWYQNKNDDKFKVRLIEQNSKLHEYWSKGNDFGECFFSTPEA